MRQSQATRSDGPAAKPRLGWIGIGKMGNPMARAVLAAGYPVTILEPLLENRASAVAAGARVAESIEALVAVSDVVVTTVARDSVLEDIVFGRDGLAGHLRAPQVFVDLSTVSPRLSAEIGDMLGARAVDYLRAPVSGSTTTARSSQLTVMVSGPKRTWLALKPMLGCFATKQFFVGEKDEARYVKLALNVLVSGTSALLGEALAVGRCSGVPLDALLDVLCESAVASPLLNYKRPSIVADDYDASFSVDQMIKDLELIGEVAAEADVPIELTNHVRRRFESARRRGLGDQDYFVLVRDHINNAASLEPKETGLILDADLA